jgi:ketosteroid isomerase-like protein
MRSSGSVSRADDNVRFVLDAFRLVERHDDSQDDEIYQPDAEFHWPPALPYGGSFRLGGDRQGRPTWAEVWAPFQPTQGERSMSPRVVAASDDEVAVEWRQRGVRRDGTRIDTPVLGLYRVRDRKFERLQMFYFDPEAVLQFLADGRDLTRVE